MPTSLGAQILVQLSDGITRLANEFAATARAVTAFPILWRWLAHELTNPAARAELLDASWKLALVVGCALGAEWLTLRAVRRPLAALELRAPTGNGNSHNSDGYRQGENPARWRGHLENLLPKKSKVRRVEHHAALPYAELGTFMTELCWG